MNSKSTIKEEIELATKADLLLCTSKQLASTYCKKHLKINIEGVYWPNTADLTHWNIESFRNKAINSGDFILGYAGNMNEITIDVDLVHSITEHYSEYYFVFAGEINFSNIELQNRFLQIIERKNIKYLGVVPYTKIQKIVSGWDICLMLDRIYELSRYVHHNKVYQYLALGKAVVSTQTHNDYTNLCPFVFEANNSDAFIKNIKQAMTEARTPDAVNKRVLLAKSNSADERAIEFINILQKHLI
jgi:glycosyltransferase involved in cell wall biosynthesis